MSNGINAYKKLLSRPELGHKKGTFSPLVFLQICTTCLLASIYTFLEFHQVTCAFQFCKNIFLLKISATRLCPMRVERAFHLGGAKAVYFKVALVIEGKHSAVALCTFY